MEYQLIKLSYNDFLEYEFEDGTVCDYEITYRDVPFRFLINVKKTSDKAVIFGTGAYDRDKTIYPVYSRNSWNDDFECTTIYYSDPSLLLNPNVRICWCYGTNRHWYLESIAYIIMKISEKLSIDVCNTVFSGSSGGGYTSLLLSIMLKAKVAAINPQFILSNYYENALDDMKSTVLQANEEFIEERISVAKLIKKENFFPVVFLMQNIYSKNDIDMQISPFLIECSKLHIPVSEFEISFYYNEEGHSGMPSKTESIRLIEKALKYNVDYKNDNCSKVCFLHKYRNGFFDGDSSTINIDSVVKSIEYILNENRLTCKLNAESKYVDYCKFAYYLVHNDDVIEKIMYTTDIEHTFTVSKPGNYKLKYFVKFDNLTKSYTAKTIQI